MQRRLVQQLPDVQGRTYESPVDGLGLTYWLGHLSHVRVFTLIRRLHSFAKFEPGYNYSPP